MKMVHTCNVMQNWLHCQGILHKFMPLDEAMASGAVIVIVSRLDGQNRFKSQPNNFKTAINRPYV